MTTPLGLRALMVADGHASPTAGDSMRSRVVNVDGARQREYLLNGVTFGGSIPVDDLPGGYGGSTLFAVTATFTAGARFNEIRNQTAGAWSFSISGGTGADVTLESYAAYPDYDALGVRIKGAHDGSPSAGTPSAVSDGGGGTGPKAVTFSAVVLNLGGAGQTLLTVTPQYNPDGGPFNPALLFNGSGQPWRGYFDNRGYDQDADFDYQWRTGASGGGALLSTNRVFYLTTDSANEVYPSDPAGLLPGEAANTIYLRWRIKPASGGNGTWNEYGAVNHTDPRDPL
ncbi:MAG: hypothetical protein C0503_02865 [Gemmatimonas sp.]|nr:hypothetical protein [Gemmatimonas sp.]